MIEMETKKINGLTVEVFPDNIKPEKLIIRGYYHESNEELKDLGHIHLELYENCYVLAIIDEGGYTYLQDEADNRYITSIYSMSNELDNDLKRLVAGEVDKLECYRDTDFLRPCDIEEFAYEGKKFDIDKDKMDTRQPRARLVIPAHVRGHPGQAQGHVRGRRLPRIEMAAQPGLSVHHDATSFRSEYLEAGVAGRRIQRMVLIPREEGEIELPALSLPWWDQMADAPGVATLPARVLRVGAPAAAGAGPDSSAARSASRMEPLAAMRTFTVVLVALAALVLWAYLRSQTLREARRQLRNACRHYHYQKSQGNTSQHHPQQDTFVLSSRCS